MNQSMRSVISSKFMKHNHSSNISMIEREKKMIEKLQARQVPMSLYMELNNM